MPHDGGAVAIEIDADIRVARALPPGHYTDAAQLARERDQVFARTWQLIGDTGQLAEVGAYVTAELAGEPIVVVRSADGLRGYYNVCPHRAGPLATGCGKRKTIQCAYHGWTFTLDGALLHAPHAEGAALDDVRLAPIAVAAWGPLVFAAIAPVMTLDELLAGIAAPPAMAWVMRRDYELACNWKVYVDNYLEGYHIPIVHPELTRELDVSAYRVVTDRWWSRQHAPLRALPGDASSRSYRPSEDGEEAEYYWVFPGLMLNIYQGQFQTNVVTPLGIDRTRVSFDWFAASPPSDPATDETWRRLVEFSDLLQVQDTGICEAVQKNLGSRGAVRGRYVPAREVGVHHFHRLLAELAR